MASVFYEFLAFVRIEKAEGCVFANFQLQLITAHPPDVDPGPAPIFWWKNEFPVA